MTSMTNISALWKPTRTFPKSTGQAIKQQIKLGILRKGVMFFWYLHKEKQTITGLWRYIYLLQDKKSLKDQLL